jgi:hypothetical protein
MPRRKGKNPYGPLSRLDENTRRMLGDPKARMRSSNGQYTPDIDRSIKDADKRLRKAFGY